VALNGVLAVLDSFSSLHHLHNWELAGPGYAAQNLILLLGEHLTQLISFMGLMKSWTDPKPMGHSEPHKSLLSPHPIFRVRKAPGSLYLYARDLIQHEGLIAQFIDLPHWASSPNLLLDERRQESLSGASFFEDCRARHGSGDLTKSSTQLCPTKCGCSCRVLFSYSTCIGY